MSFTTIGAWIGRQHRLWQIPLFIGYAIAWIVWQALGVLYAICMLVLGCLWGRRPTNHQRTVWAVRTGLAVPALVFIGFAALAGYQMLGPLIFPVLVLAILYAGAKMLVLSWR